MTATSETSPKRNRGFTIESLIGKDTDRKDASPPHHLGNTDKCCAIELKGERGNRHSEQQFVNIVGPSRESLNLAAVARHRDAVASLGTISTGESLKHIHEALAHSAGTEAAFLSPRFCRHPLSTLNLPSMYPSHLPPSSPLHPMVLNGNRDMRHVYSWFSDRYPSYMYPRYTVGAGPGLLFQPYRKPKRIRTAFSPSQLLRLDRSFEKSHYVVGQERKELATDLQLTETQVKVWFQNRRTKHKRMKAEEEAGICHVSSDDNTDHLADDEDRVRDSEDSDIGDITDDLDVSSGNTNQ